MAIEWHEQGPPASRGVAGVVTLSLSIVFGMPVLAAIPSIKRVPISPARGAVESAVNAEFANVK